MNRVNLLSWILEKVHNLIELFTSIRINNKINEQLLSKEKILIKNYFKQAKINLSVLE